MAFSLAHDVHVGEYLVRIRCAGTGHPLLLLHDIGGSGASFLNLTSGIVASGREAVAPDLPGFAQSDPIPGGLPEMIEHLQELVDQTIQGDVDVVGRGFGGFLALSLAAQRPTRFRTIVLQDPMTPPQSGRASSRMTAGMALNGAFTTVRRGRLLQNVGGFGRAKGLLEQLARADQEWWESLRAVRARCLLLEVGDARPDDRSRFRELKDAVPDLEHVSVAGEKTAETDAERAILRFIDQQNSAG